MHPPSFWSLGRKLQLEFANLSEIANVVSSGNSGPTARNRKRLQSMLLAGDCGASKNLATMNPTMTAPTMPPTTSLTK